MRDSSSLEMIPFLSKKGAKIKYYDPTGLKKEFNKLKNVSFSNSINEAVKEAVAGNLGLAILSRHTLSGNLKHSGVAELNVQGFPIQSNWFIVYPKAKQLSPIANAFLKNLL